MYTKRVSEKHLDSSGCVTNATTELECIPDSLKIGIITPVYKGGEKDPLDTNNYRGVILTSVLAKVLESLLLTRLQCHFQTKAYPISIRQPIARVCPVQRPYSRPWKFYQYIHNAAKRSTCASMIYKRHSTQSSTPFS